MESNDLGHDEILRLFGIDIRDAITDPSGSLEELIEICKEVSDILGNNETCQLVSAPTVDFCLDLNAVCSTQASI